MEVSDAAMLAGISAAMLAGIWCCYVSRYLMLC